MKNNKFVLCPIDKPDDCAPPCGPPPYGGPCPGCPVVTKEKNQFKIDDDYGDTVRIDDKDITKLINDLNDLLS